jgi:hypothetical protein
MGRNSQKTKLKNKMKTKPTKKHIEKFTERSYKNGRTTEVTWENEHEGMMKITYSSGGVRTTTAYSLQRAVENLCYTAAIRLINSPLELQKEEPLSTVGRQAFSPLQCVYPEIPFPKSHEIHKKIEKLGTFLKKELLEFGRKETDENDLEFLFHLGLKRNWKRECAICLVDDIMGTTCGCGHTEITVFRPCGHSVCTNPCAQEIMKSNNIETRERRIETTEGSTMIIVGTTDVSNIRNIKCHLCRANITSAFQAQDLMINESEIIRDICNRYASDIIKQLD